MDGGANLRDTRTLMAAKAILVKTGRSLATAIEEAVSDAERFGMWLDGAGPSEWERQLRLRTDKLNGAKSALYRKQMQPTADGRPPSVVDERKAVQRAEAAVEEARQYLRALKRWGAEYQRVLGQFRAGLSPLSHYVESTVPRAVTSINKMAEAIDAYLTTQPARAESFDADSDGVAPDAGDAGSTGGSMRRGGSEESSPKENPSE